MHVLVHIYRYVYYVRIHTIHVYTPIIIMPYM